MFPYENKEIQELLSCDLNSSPKLKRSIEVNLVTIKGMITKTEEKFSTTDMSRLKYFLHCHKSLNELKDILERHISKNKCQ